MVVGKTLRFIDDNFRMQGWQGKSFQKWEPNARKGTILVKNGHLRRGFNYGDAGFGAVRFYNNVKYAAVHNRGFDARVKVPEHKRARYAKSKVFSVNEFTKSGRRKSQTVTNKIGEGTVQAHSRHMKIRQRQFAPYEGSESPVLNKSITRELEREISKILTFK